MASRAANAPGARTQRGTCPLDGFSSLHAASRWLIGGARFLVVFALLFALDPAVARAQTVSVQTISPQNSTSAQQASERRVTSYTLPPDTYRKAHELGQISFWGDIGSAVYWLVAMLILLRARLAPQYRDWAERVNQGRFRQALIFAPLFVATLELLEMPVDAAEHWLGLRFALSVQGWSSWLMDWAKSSGLEIVGATIFIWILYAVIRRSPHRWWFYFWAATVPIIIFLVFLQPVFVDPMFHKFVPLEQKNAPLAAALEQMVQRSGENIPVERIFWMGASEKTNELNAYVTGIGASKRIVVWDTTISKLDTPEAVSVVGHEMGHYVLHHIPKGIAASEASLLVMLYLGYRLLGWLLARHGARWGIREVSDWASLPVLLLLIGIFGFASDPLQNAFSRYIEHQADQYGLEVTHGLVADSGQVAAKSFQVLGEVDLEDPAPNPAAVLLFYTHPPIDERIRFALNYDPWAAGGRGEFVP
jgi:STE24 endopeptidase